MMCRSASGGMLALALAAIANPGAVTQSDQAPAVALKDLKRHVGEEVVACGPVFYYECDDAGGSLRLFLDKPDQQTVVVVPREYWPDSRGRSLTDRAFSSTVCARGTVRKEKGAYRVMIHAPVQVEVRNPAPVPPVDFAPAALHTCAAGVTPPRLLREVKPSYTRDAMRALLEGKVYLEAEVLDDGSVGAVREWTTLPHNLGRQAIEALKQWRFAPARLAGRTVPVVVTVEMTFTLR